MSSNTLASVFTAEHAAQKIAEVTVSLLGPFTAEHAAQKQAL